MGMVVTCEVGCVEGLVVDGSGCVVGVMSSHSCVS